MGLPNKPGVYPGLSWSDYDKIKAVNNSLLQRLRKSPAHARHYLDHSDESTVPQVVGEATHAAVLEPPRFAEQYVARPQFEGHPNSKAHKEARKIWEAEHEKQVILSGNEYALCESLRDAVWAHPIASEILSGKGSNEVVVLWKDPGTGILCKARIDRFTSYKKQSIIAEFKTTRDASAWAFSRDAAKFRYHHGGAWYRRGLQVLDNRYRKFHIIAAEKEPPYGVAVYELEEEALDVAEGVMQHLMYEYQKCEESGVWPGYPVAVQKLQLPKWTNYELQDEEAKDGE